MPAEQNGRAASRRNRQETVPSTIYASGLAKAAVIAAQNGLPLGNGADRRYSVAALWSMAAENDVEVDDELTQAQRRLKDLKTKISAQSKKNFLLERDVRFLDSRIALLIQNRMALDEQQEVASHLEELDTTEGHLLPDERKRQLYGNLFFLLQNEPRHIAALARLVSLSEIDTLLQTVMFTLYGNQYDSREEYLLLSMFQNVLSSQFDAATDFGSLLRANTPVSRMLTTYTRRGPGQTYLKHVLSARINKLIEMQDLDLEINPLKVYERMIEQIETATGKPSDLPKSISPEEASQHPDVQAIIAPRLVTLMEIAESFLTTIMGSLDQVPYGIRWICKQIRSLTKRKYPDASDLQICSLIGGFFFLRFINPAIVTPQAYMLVEGNPAQSPRRTLTLIAKMLQNLANKPTYSKEVYMMSLNPFVEQHKQRINRFLNELCEVGDFYESLEMDQYIALSKKDITLNISLNELYNTHSLLMQHMDVLAAADKHHLRICLQDLGSAPAQVPRAENKTVELPIFSRWEQPIPDFPSAIADSELTSSDIMYMDTKALYVQIIRTMPGLSSAVVKAGNKGSAAFNLARVAESAATSRDPTLVKKGIKVREMLYQLDEVMPAEQRQNPNRYALMCDEIRQELVHLGNLREKVDKEIGSLELVFKTIIDHNNYLRSQLESYKAYLQNVRIKSGVTGSKSSKAQVQGPFKFTHAHLEKDGIIVESNVPDNRRSNIFFNILSPLPGTFIIALHYKGREKAILEMDLKLDDLLEKQQLGVTLLDLEYVQLSVNKTLALLNKTFLKR
ncbi:Rho GTPase activation protein [Fimicolochytrium jonesii]|uniref:Rho GTPase activation protein n=1 Tax=Fimicolochytrium jonesii TaxID=1396493 RepID=UPI0022FECE53|nr:Rho GTPase activation protein [Fimicolochytrium jonesii]KAI8824293.1 Rho GTPase activation protein [Fimicolochytrium jonesii]